MSLELSKDEFLVDVSFSVGHTPVLNFNCFAEIIQMLERFFGIEGAE